MPEETPQEKTEKTSASAENGTLETDEETPETDEESEDAEEEEEGKVDEEEEEGDQTAPGPTFSIFEWMIVFFIALLGDALDIILHIGTVTIPAAWVIDLIMVVIIGGWIFMRASAPEEAEETKEKIPEIYERKKKPIWSRGRWKGFPKKRFALSFVGEIIPWFGMVFFGWTLLMLTVLRKYR